MQIISKYICKSSSKNTFFSDEITHENTAYKYKIYSEKSS